MASVGAVDPVQYVPNLLQKMAFVESARRGGCGAECVSLPTVALIDPPPSIAFQHGQHILLVPDMGPDRVTLAEAAERYGVWAAGLHGSDGELVP